MRVGELYRSTIGKKVIMGLTGIIWVGFVIAHMSGNLLVFSGAAAINGYALKLREYPALLWGLRGVLAVALILHVVAAIQLTRLQQVARPVDYHHRRPQVSTWGGRTIRWGGVLLLAFILLHLLHFTTGDIDPGFVHGDVYGNVVRSFRIWWVAALYLVAMAALGLHLYHGVASVMQTAGVTDSTLSPRRRVLAWLLAVIVAGGFSLVPIAVFAGLVGAGGAR